MRGSIESRRPDSLEMVREQLKNPSKTVRFEKGQVHEGLELNGVKFSPIKAEPDWSQEKDHVLDDEPVFKINDDWLRPASGALVVEDDGRVWIYEPANHFGGYEHTYPKGRPDKGLSLQQTARKEVLEETGLLIDIVGYLGDYEKTTTMTRYYIAKRIGGDPGMADGYRGEGEIEEVWNVKLVPQAELEDYLNRSVDRDVAEDLRYKLAQ